MARPMITAALIAISASAMPITNKRPLGDRAEIEHHADREEEQAEQDRAERLDVGLELVPVGRIGEHHAGDERAERGRQAEQLHHRGAGDHREQAGEDEHLALAEIADQPEQRPEQEAAGEHQPDDRADRVERRAASPAARRRRPGCATSPRRS